MGTNYYAIPKRPSLSNKAIHIGKSSAGWRFLFRGYQDEEVYYGKTLTINSVEDWKKFLDNDDLVILNEYDDLVDKVELFKMIEEKQLEDNPDNFSNCANINGYRFSFRDFG